MLAHFTDYNKIALPDMIVTAILLALCFLSGHWVVAVLLLLPLNVLHLRKYGIALVRFVM